MDETTASVSDLRVPAALALLRERAGIVRLPARCVTEVERLADLLPEETVEGLGRRVWDVRIDWLPLAA